MKTRGLLLRWSVWLVATLGAVVTAPTLSAQPSTSTSFVLAQATVGGAGTTSTSTSFVLDGTLSQAATVGEATSTSFVLESGFWTSGSVDQVLTVLGAGSGRGTMTGGTVVACTTDAGATSGDCGETRINGTSLAITAVPDASNAFDGWSGCTSTSTASLPDDTCTVVLSADRTVTATFTALGSAADIVWRDIDGDGKKDPGEPGIDGVTVDLTGPGGPLQTVTAAGGLYGFPDLYPGSYTVTVDDASLPPGVFPTFDLDGVATPDSATFTVADGEHRDDVDFGYQPRLDLVITKDDDADPLPGGDNLTYTLTIDNLGPAPATGVVITDNLPAGTTLVATSGCGEDPVGVPTCTVGDLAIGAMALVTIEVSIDPMPPASITNTATVASVEFDLLGTNNSDHETTSLDNAPPRVSLVDTDGTTPDGVLRDCETVHGQPVDRLLVRFDDAMLDPDGDTTAGDVTNPDSWLLVRPGADASFDTTGCDGPSGDDEEVEVVSITYDEGTATATLDADGPLDGSLYRLYACGTGASFLRDRAGNGLDGDGDGTGGDDFLRFFRADPGNALADGHLDCDLGAWVPVATNPMEIVHDAEDVDGSADSGSAAFENLTASTDFALGQCVASDADTPYDLSAAVRMTTTSAIGIVVRLSCEHFDAPGCGGTSLGTPSSLITLLADTGATWVTFADAFTTPAGTASSLCAIDFATPTAEDFDARVDRLELIGPFSIFEDGFESGDTSSWTSTVP